MFIRCKLTRIVKNIPLVNKIWFFCFKQIDALYYKKHCSDYTIIPFGNHCLSRVIANLSRLKPRKFYGEKTCPLDILFSLDFNSNIELFRTKFEHFYDDIEFSERRKMWINPKLDIIFPHDMGITFDELKKRYDTRIKNLYDYVNDKSKHLYFLTSISTTIEKIVTLTKDELHYINEENIKKFIEAIREYRDDSDFDIIIINQSDKPIYTDIKNVHIIDLVNDKDFDTINVNGDWVRELDRRKNKHSQRYYTKLTKELSGIIRKRTCPAKIKLPIPFFRAKMANPKYAKIIKDINYGYELKNTEKIIPQMISKEDAVDILLNSKKSLSRFGDGEFALMQGANLAFQPASKELQNRLIEILHNGNENLLVGIPDAFHNLDDYAPKYVYYWRNWMVWNRNEIYKMLDMSKPYCNSFISRPYMLYKNKKNASEFFKKLKELWKNKDIVIVEGEFSTLGASNDLFKNAKSVKRILCPATNAYSRYWDILEYCKSFSDDTLFILALGPTATVLADDLSKNGYQAFDLGNIDAEYIWCQKKVKKIIPIRNKFVYEADCGKNVGKEDSPEYKKQVVKTFTEVQ